MKFFKAAVTLCVTVAVSSAYAAVSFDPGAGTGFVGKGDIQTVLAWNNKQLQDNASGLLFSYQTEDKYDATCEWSTTTGGPKSKVIWHDITVKKTVTISSGIVYEARQKSQITGFNLLDFGTVTQNIEAPAEGGACQGEGQNGTWTEVTQTGTTGGLYVTNPVTKMDVLLPTTPVI